MRDSAERSETIGVLLAGGASTRLGRDKATLHLPAGGPAAGYSLLEWGALRLRPLVGEVLLAARGRFEQEGADLGLRSVADGAGRGPASGILGAADAVPGRSLLVLACDLPWVDRSLLEEILDARGEADWSVARTDGGLEPLCALYRPLALDALRDRVAQGRFALHPLEQLVRTTEVPADSEKLFNLNTPHDLELFQTLRRAPKTEDIETEDVEIEGGKTDGDER